MLFVGFVLVGLICGVHCTSEAGSANLWNQSAMKSMLDLSPHLADPAWFLRKASNLENEKNDLISSKCGWQLHTQNLGVMLQQDWAYKSKY